MSLDPNIEVVKEGEVIQDDNLSDYHDAVALHHAPGTPVHLRLLRDRSAHAKNNQGKFTEDDVKDTVRRLDMIKDQMKKISKKAREESSENEEKFIPISLDDDEDWISGHIVDSDD